MDTLDQTKEQLLEELESAKLQISELKKNKQRAEETLRVLKDNTAKYLDLAEVILVALDEQGKVIMVSGKCFEILGYVQDELLGKNWFEVCLPPEDCQSVRSVFNKLVEGVTDNVEYYSNDVLTKYGKRIHVAWHNSLLLDDSGKIIGTLSAGTDVTERRHIEAVLRQSEVQFRSIIDVSPVPCALNDENQRITYLNPAFVDTFGYDLTDIPTLDEWWPRAYPDPAYLEMVKSSWRERLEKAENHSTVFKPLEVDVRCKDGTVRTVLASAADFVDSFKGNHLVILYDITDRKRAEGAVRESERKYRSLFENMTSGFALHEIITNELGEPVDYKFLELNPAFEKLTGVPTSKLLGKTILEVMPDTEKYWIQTFGKVALTGESIAYENYSRELGKYYDTWAFSPQKNQFAVIFSDITKRKQAEEKLREGDKYFQVLFAQSSFGVAKVDSHTGRFAKINQRFCDLLGYSRDEMLAKNFKQITYPDDLPGDLENMSMLRAGEIEQFQREKRYLKKDGSNLWVNISVMPLWDRTETPDYHMTIVEDITKRKNAEEKLKHQKDEQQQIINTMVDAVITINETGTIQTFSQSARQMFGYSESETIGENIKKIMPSVYAEQHDNYLANYLSTNEAHIIGMPREVSGKRKDGEVFPLRLSVAELPRNADGSRRFIGSCQDVTVLKQQEEQLRRSQKMDALGKLTGGIAHDYNNMLGIILGYSQILQDELHNNPKLLKLANEIRYASERGAKLSRKLLAFTRKKEPEESVIDINKTLSAEIDLLQKTLTPRIVLSLDFAEDIWPVCLDSGDLEDAVLNMSINAMHAMEGGGELKISTRNISYRKSLPATLSKGDYVAIEFSDTGIGMNQEMQNKIFDPFYSTKGDLGIGLGLSMVYGFVKRSGGDIEVNSSPGEGAQFIIYLPRYTGVSKTKERKKHVDTVKYQGTETILVVDDEPAMVSLITQMLVPNGYQVFSARDGEEALQVMENESIDLLISDVIMPVMDGFKLAEQTRKKFPRVNIQLISGYADNKNEGFEDLELNQNLLYKPFTTLVLLDRIRSILNGKVNTGENKQPVVMVMDDEPDMRDLFRINFEKLGYRVVLTACGEEAIENYRISIENKNPINAVILDLSINGGMGGEHAAKKILEMDKDAVLIVSSGNSSGSIMRNFSNYGFRAAIEKNFDREEIKKVLNEVMISSAEK